MHQKGIIIVVVVYSRIRLESSGGVLHSAVFEMIANESATNKSVVL